MLLSLAGDTEWIEKETLNRFVADSLKGDANSDSDADSQVGDAESDDAPARKKKKKQKLSKPTVSDLLTAIVRTQGLQNPIAVIGYTRMLRGESFVSGTVNIDGEDRRLVPTHMLCGLAPGRSVEDLVQMAGRSTFNGRSVLHRNRGANAKVKILIHHRDWDLAIAYYNFQDRIFDLLNKGKRIDEVLDTEGSHIKHEWCCDITAFLGRRTIGARKRENRLDDGLFERAETLDLDELKKTFPGRYWASRHCFMEFDQHGMQHQLRSPIPKDEHLKMKQMEREIEEYLYHEKDHFQNSAIILRRALMIAKPQWERGSSASVVRWHGSLAEPAEPAPTIFTSAGGDGHHRDELLRDAAKLQRPRNGGAVKLVCKPLYTRFEPARACNTCDQSKRKGSWWQKRGDCWPLFVVVEGRQGAFGGQKGSFGGVGSALALNPKIINFARKFAKYILQQPPLYSFHDVQQYCIGKKLIAREDTDTREPDCTSSSPSSAQPTQRRRGPGRPKGQSHPCVSDDACMNTRVVIWSWECEGPVPRCFHCGWSLLCHGAAGKRGR